jgi:DNA-binding GntR family transcriptional regulator
MSFKKDTSFQTKIDIVSNRILESILNGSLKPRDRIQINSVAKSLGFSIIPVREAIRKLEAQGLLEIEPHKGVSVREPDINELEDIFEVRILLECRAARRALEAIEGSDLRELRAIYEAMEKVLEQRVHSSIVKYFSLNRKFHGSLYRISGNAFLCKTIENIAMTIEPHLLKYISSPASRKIAQQDHGRILEACENRDVKLIENTITRHLKNILSTIIKLTRNGLKDK